MPRRIGLVIPQCLGFMLSTLHPSIAIPLLGTLQANSEPPRLHEVRGPASAAAWLANARSLPSSTSAASGSAAANTNPYLSGAAGAAAAAAARPGAQQHRSARLVLTFPQFLEVSGLLDWAD